MNFVEVLDELNARLQEVNTIFDIRGLMGELSDVRMSDYFDELPQHDRDEWWNTVVAADEKHYQGLKTIFERTGHWPGDIHEPINEK